MRLKKKKISKGKILKIYFPKKRLYYISPIKWLLLIFLGARDAKCKAYIDTDFPFVEYERSKVNKYVAKLVHILQKRTSILKLNFDSEIIVLEQRMYAVAELTKRLEGSVFPEEIVIVEHNGLPEKLTKFLETKRECEKSLDDKAIRARRFNEYQKNLLPIKNELTSEMHKLMRSYKFLIGLVSNLNSLYEQVNTLIRKYVSFINMQIALYRRGWFIMKNKKGLPGAVPCELNYEGFVINYEPRIEDIQKSITDIIDRYKNILK